MIDKEINFLSLRREEPYEIVAVFKDSYGSMWDLLEPSTTNKGFILNN